jgi:hypothetical protein
MQRPAGLYTSRPPELPIDCRPQQFERRRPADQFTGRSVTFMLLPRRQHALLYDGVDPPVAAPPPLACTDDEISPS